MRSLYTEIGVMKFEKRMRNLMDKCFKLTLQKYFLLAELGTASLA